MKRILPSSIFLFLILATLCGPAELIASNKPETLLNKKKSKTGFIENKGQIIDQKNKPNPAVLYLLNTPGFNVQLRASGWSYDLFQITSSPAPLLKERGGHSTKSSLLLQEKGLRDEVTSANSYLFHRIDINLVGANPHPTLENSAPSSDYLNYYTTGIPTEGVTGVRSFARVTYQNIYPGIDLQFISDDRSFEYNFILHPGADINSIKLKIYGPQKIKSYREVLHCETSLGVVNETIPVCYYTMQDVRSPVKGRFKKIAEHIYGFAVDQVIPSGAVLLIDPYVTRIWGTYYGGTDEDVDEGLLAVDKFHNVFLGGWTSSTNNIATIGAYQTVFGGGIEDGYIAKMTAGGQRIWGTYYGGELHDSFWGCSADSAGNIYAVGVTTSETGIATAGAHQTTNAGNEDAFLVKLNANGQRVWATYYGGSEQEDDWSCTTDRFGNVIIAGTTASDDNISTPGSYQPNRYGNKDAYIAKFDSNGTFLWGSYFGGEGDDAGYDCVTDTNGTIYMSGNTLSMLNIATPFSHQPVYGGGPRDDFLSAFSSNGQQRLWATYYGGNQEETGGYLSIDNRGNLYLSGETNSDNGISTVGSFQPLRSGNYDSFLVKFRNSGQRAWGTYYGGSLQDGAQGSSISSNGDIFLSGFTHSINNIATPGSFYPSYTGGFSDGYLVKFDSLGIRMWGTYYGGPDIDFVYKCSYVADDSIYLVGTTWSVTGITTNNTFQPVFGGYFDAFLVKFLDCWPIEAAGSITGPVNVCSPSTGVSYSIPQLAHAINYIWTLPPGFTISSGAGTQIVFVDISTSASSGTIWVKGVNKCNDPGDSASLFVTVNPAPVPVIFGPNITCAGTGKVYTTAFGKTNYQWSISVGGVITSGGTTTDNTVTVTWNAVGTQHVYVNYTDAGCTAPTPTDYLVTVTPSPAVNVTITASLNPVCAGTLVTFTAAPTNGGGNPFCQWKVNGINSGINSVTYSYTPLNNDQVTCILTSSVTGCIMNNPDTSNVISMIVNPDLPVGITITALPNPPVCSGTTVTFTAHPVNEGNTPNYQWKVNGNPVGINLTTYSYIPADGDLISCVLNSSEPCTIINPVTSAQYPVSISPILPVSVSISPSENPFCASSPVTFIAASTHGGFTPSYQWKVNGANAGTNSDVFTYDPANNDQVFCILTSSETCTSNNPTSSIVITMVENNILPASVSIAASSNPFCPGSSVTFNATPTNGGIPAYQWKVNGINVGINSSTYSYNPVNNDSVRCVMTSTLNCVTGNPASSNKIIMSGNLAPSVSFMPCFDTITTVNAKPIKLKGGIPLGGVYSGPGVNSVTSIFTPSIAGTGTKTITYTYTNVLLCSAAKSISILDLPSSNLTCGNALTDVRDNKVYQTIQIGSQCWLAEDLNYGNEIPDVQDQRDNCIAEKYSTHPSPLTTHSFYQWDEVMQYDETPAGQGFCPPGWHIPTENDWNTLFANWSNNAFAGSPLKYSGYSGFNALLSGARHINKSWDFQGFAAFFWSSTPIGSTKAYAHGMNDPDPSVSLYPSSRANAFSVRCLKD